MNKTIQLSIGFLVGMLLLISPEPDFAILNAIFGIFGISINSLVHSLIRFVGSISILVFGFILLRDAYRSIRNNKET